MELSNPTNTSIPSIKNEAQCQTPTKIHQAKPLTFVNGNHHHHAVVVKYKECLKNHAATMGGLAVDGCGEFMPSTNTTNPIDLKCAACGCHRNFHRREPPPQPPPNTFPALEYQPHHRHHPPPPPLNLNIDDQSTPSSPSPPPISSSYPPSASHMLLALSGGGSGGFSCGRAIENNDNSPVSTGIITPVSNPNINSRKRFRTKFSQYQKDKMLKFAEKVGWKFQKKDEDVIMEVCNEIGIDKGVLKVWLHNNKNTLGKKDHNFNITPSENVNQIEPSRIPLNGVGSSNNANINGNGNGFGGGAEYDHYHHDGGGTTDNNNCGRSLDQLHQLLSTTANGSASS